MRQVIVLGVLTVVLTGVLVARAEARPPGFWTKRAIAKYFPRHARAYAFRIAGCETGYTYSRYTTGAAGEHGVFQIHPSNAGRLLTWGRKRARIVWARTYEINYSVRMAAIWTRGGQDWSEWTCSRLVRFRSDTTRRAGRVL